MIGRVRKGSLRDKLKAVAEDSERLEAQHKSLLSATSGFHKDAEEARKKYEIGEKKKETIESFIKPLQEQKDMV